MRTRDPACFEPIRFRFRFASPCLVHLSCGALLLTAAVGGGGCGGLSAGESLPAVESLRATASLIPNAQGAYKPMITLSWIFPEDAQTFDRVAGPHADPFAVKVERSADAGKTWRPIGPNSGAFAGLVIGSNSTDVIDNELTAGASYRYRATLIMGQPPRLTAPAVTIEAVAPDPHTPVVLTNAQIALNAPDTSSSIAVAWRCDPRAPDVRGYEVVYARAGATAWSSATVGTIASKAMGFPELIIPRLQPASRYAVRVRAARSDGTHSDWSDLAWAYTRSAATASPVVLPQVGHVTALTARVDFDWVGATSSEAAEHPAWKNHVLVVERRPLGDASKAWTVVTRGPGSTFPLCTVRAVRRPAVLGSYYLELNDLIPNQGYEFRFRAQPASGTDDTHGAPRMATRLLPEVQSVPEQVVTVTTLAANIPATPIDLAVSAGLGQNALHWRHSDGCTGVAVYRRSGGGAFALLTTINGNEPTNYIDSTVRSGTFYEYHVVALRGRQRSAPSQIASIISAGPGPDRSTLAPPPAEGLAAPIVPQAALNTNTNTNTNTAAGAPLAAR